MTDKHHLVVSITAHGYGHVAQTAPVLNALYRKLPGLKITVRCGIDPEHLRARIQAPFSHLVEPGDIGMLMSSPLDVRVAESRIAYRGFHSSWDRRVANEARLLRDMRADFVLSNVGYLPLAGAARAGIPCAALCSLNWADLYRHYCGDDDIAAQIQSCYANAEVFLRATPGMAMSDLPNVLPVAPIAAVGRNRRAELDRLLHLPSGERLVLVSLGGIASRLPVGAGPEWTGCAGWCRDAGRSAIRMRSRSNRCRWISAICWPAATR